MSEEWKDAPGYPMYEVSSHGNVRRKPVALKPGKIPTGHLTVALSKGRGKGPPKSVYVHRLVAMAFLESDGSRPLVNHINGNPKDNRRENLEWLTYSENIRHGYRSNGRRTPHEKKLAAIDANGEWVMSFRSGSDAGRLLGVYPSAVNSAARRKGTCKGYRWIYL